MTGKTLYFTPFAIPSHILNLYQFFSQKKESHSSNKCIWKGVSEKI